MCLLSQLILLAEFLHPRFRIFVWTRNLGFVGWCLAVQNSVFSHLSVHQLHCDIIKKFVHVVGCTSCIHSYNLTFVYARFSLDWWSTCSVQSWQYLPCKSKSCKTKSWKLWQLSRRRAETFAASCWILQVSIFNLHRLADFLVLSYLWLRVVNTFSLSQLANCAVALVFVIRQKFCYHFAIRLL